MSQRTVRFAAAQELDMLDMLDALTAIERLIASIRVDIAKGFLPQADHVLQYAVRLQTAHDRLSCALSVADADTMVDHAYTALDRARPG